MFKDLLIVGFGSFIGGVTRYVTIQIIHKFINTNFPLGTLVVNLLGCFLIGILYGLFDKGSIMSAEIKLFLIVGICGGFTTFSSFTYETISLVNDSEVLYLMVYMGMSIFTGISMTLIGKNIVDYFIR